MPEKENNHYVPRLILRKFDEKISTYNLKTKELKLNQKLEKVFVSKKLYSKEIETMFNEKVEIEFARVLKDKILKTKDECVLSRLEVNIIKKFLVLAMLRTMDSEYFTQSKAEKAREDVRINYKFEECAEISLLSSFDYWMQTIRCILEAKSPFYVQKNNQATAIAVYWANVFMSGYIAIWDSTISKEEFVIMDQGMTSEHEKTRFLQPYNNDMLKRGYLFERTFFRKQPASYDEKNIFFKYMQLALANDGFSENMYLFTISKNRMIALINPFFRLYDKDDWNNFSNYEEPDIWTTSIKDRHLFAKNKNDYVDLENSKSGEHSENDKFIYKIQDMNLEDVIYVNCLILDRIHTIVGFSETSGIRRSLITYHCIPGALNNYTDLISQLSEFGYEMNKTKKYQEIAAHASLRDISFSESEKKYIDNFLKIKELSEQIKKENIQ